jgi:heme exporter protein D
VTVYEWMFHTPYFLGIVVVGVVLLAVVGMMERTDRLRAERDARIAERRSRSADRRHSHSAPGRGN